MLVYISAILLLLIPRLGAEDTVRAGTTESYVVRTGDSLSSIAQRMLGDAKLWPNLVEWNGLEVHYRDGVAIVWLTPGQIILLGPEEPHVSPQAVHEYCGHTKDTMEREIFRMAGIRSPFPRWHDFDISVRVNLNHGNLRSTIVRLNRWTEHLHHLERYQMVDDIFNWALADMRLYKLFPNETYWVQHRKTCLLLLAVLDVESDGMFARGSHGELGPFQIKPRTFKVVTGRKDAYILMENFVVGLRCAMSILNDRDKLRHSVANYNRGKGDRKWIYADQVLASFNRMLLKAEKSKG